MRHVRIAAIVVVMAMVAWGCGDSGTDETTIPPTETTTTTQPPTTTTTQPPTTTTTTEPATTTTTQPPTTTTTQPPTVDPPTHSVTLTKFNELGDVASMRFTPFVVENTLYLMLELLEEPDEANQCVFFGLVDVETYDMPLSAGWGDKCFPPDGENNTYIDWDAPVPLNLNAVLFPITLPDANWDLLSGLTPYIEWVSYNTEQPTSLYGYAANEANNTLELVFSLADPSESADQDESSEAVDESPRLHEVIVPRYRPGTVVQDDLGTYQVNINR